MLDEATSALDENSQWEVQIALDNVIQHRTSIVIAHRLTTIQKCDWLLVLENGWVVEEGTFAELRDLGGVFSRISWDAV